MTAEKLDVYTHVTNQIIAQIEVGTPPWRKPWTGGGASVSLPERFNGEAYRGINILMLWAAAMVKDYRPPMPRLTACLTPTRSRA